jgi:hypothetical protein
MGAAAGVQLEHLGQISPASGDAADGSWPKNGRCRLPGVVPPPALADPEVVVDADVLDAVAANPTRDQRQGPAAGSIGP